MKKWEIKYCNEDDGEEKKRCEEDGWEPVTVIQVGESFWIYFRRSYEDEEKN